MEGEMDPKILQGHLVSQCWKSTSVGKGLHCKDRSGPVCSIVCRCFEHGASPRMSPKMSRLLLGRLCHVQVTLCWNSSVSFFPCLEVYRVNLLPHLLSPRCVSEWPLFDSALLPFPPTPFKSYPLPAFFPSEFKGVGEAEFNHWASLALLSYGIEPQSLAVRELHNKL